MDKLVKLLRQINVYYPMKLSKEINEELNNISSLLAGMEKKNVFSVPEGYFIELNLNVIKKVNASSNQDGDLTVPAGYFENLTASILSNIKSGNDKPAEELRKLSPMLYSIQNENVFEVPTGYFRNLEYDILDKVIPRPPAKVVEFKKRDTIWKYAAAAVVTGIIGLNSLMMFNSSGTSADSQLTKSLIQTSSQFKNEQQINGAIATLSDDDIIKYLERMGTDIDNEALVTGIEASDLPAEKDYLLDENTLDIYLKETDKGSQN